METAGVSICSAEATLGGAGRTSVSQAGHPAGAQTQGNRPTDQAPGLSSEQGRAPSESPQEPTLARWERPFNIAAIWGFSSFCSVVVETFLQIIFVFSFK